MQPSRGCSGDLWGDRRASQPASRSRYGGNRSPCPASYQRYAPVKPAPVGERGKTNGRDYVAQTLRRYGRMYYSPDGRIRLTVITRPVDLLAIEPEWRALWASSREALLTYSVEATRALIAFPLRRRHERLWCLVGRVDGALVLVWPFIIYRHF